MGLEKILNAGKRFIGASLLAGSLIFNPLAGNAYAKETVKASQSEVTKNNENRSNLAYFLFTGGHGKEGRSYGIEVGGITSYLQFGAGVSGIENGGPWKTNPEYTWSNERQVYGVLGLRLLEDLLVSGTGAYSSQKVNSLPFVKKHKGDYEEETITLDKRKYFGWSGQLSYLYPNKDGYLIISGGYHNRRGFIGGIGVAGSRPYTPTNDDHKIDNHYQGYVIFTGGAGNFGEKGASKNGGIEVAFVFPWNDYSKFLDSRFLLGFSFWVMGNGDIPSEGDKTPSGRKDLKWTDEGGFNFVGGLRLLKNVYAIGAIGSSGQQVSQVSSSYEWADEYGNSAPYYDVFDERYFKSWSLGLRYLNKPELSSAFGLEYNNRRGIVGAIGLGW